MKKLLTALSAALLATAAFAQATLPPVEGEVRKIDTDAKKITLRHGDIPNLEMTGMTMVFRVNDPALLAKVKPGDKVRFTADKVGGALTVISIEPEN
jgi:Cu/Ag efflux protein CusF